MADNIFTRIYGNCAECALKTGNYTSVLCSASEVCVCKNKKGLAVVMPSCHMRNCSNLKLIKYVYEVGGSVIIVDISYCDIEYLHSVLGINVAIGYAQQDDSCCKDAKCCCSKGSCYFVKPVEKLGYYGVAKGFNLSINQFYFKIEKCDILRQVLKGVGIDEVGLWLDTNIANANKPMLQAGIQAPIENDLTRLASAQNITFRVQGGTDLPYYDRSLWNGQSNSYGINFSIYPAHSLVDNSDYYYIEQEGVYNFNNNYVNQYKYNYQGAQSKIEELYCSDLVTDCYLDIESQYVDILRLSPATTEGQTSITSGVSFNLSGGVAVKEGDATVSVSGGISVSNTRSFTVSAVSVYNRSTDNGSNAKWEYVLTKTDSEFSFFSYGQVDLIDGSRTGHSTFVPFNQWIWKVAPGGRVSGDTMQCVCDLTVTLTSSRGRLLAPGYTAMDNNDYPFFKKFVFDIKQAPLA